MPRKKAKIILSTKIDLKKRFIILLSIVYFSLQLQLFQYFTDGNIGVVNTHQHGADHLLIEYFQLLLAFGVRAVSDGVSVIQAVDHVFAVAPGDYILSREANPSAARLDKARSADIAPYCAPPPDPPGDYQPWPLPLAVRAKALAGRFARRDEVNLLERTVCIKAPDYRKKGFWDVRRTVDVDAVQVAFPSAGEITALVFEGRSLVDHDEPVEIACTFADGSVLTVSGVGDLDEAVKRLTVLTFTGAVEGVPQLAFDGSVENPDDWHLRWVAGKVKLSRTSGMMLIVR